MISSLSMVKCMYPGCGTWMAAHPKRRFCAAHSQLLLEVEKRQAANNPLFPPIPKTKSVPTPTPSPESPPSADMPVRRRMRTAQQRQIEVLKRKIVKKRSHDPQ